MIRLIDLDESKAKELFAEILQIPGLRGEYYDIISPDIIESVMPKIIMVSGVPDPFSIAKRRQNEIALGLYPSFQSLVEEPTDPLLMAVKLAILGNAVDFMVPHSTEQMERVIKENLETTLSEEEYGEFRNRLKTSKKILIFGDNSGEIVLDRLFIETIRENNNPEIIYVVRSMPVMNDSTMEEARFIGMDRVARLVENGIQGPFPGSRMGRCRLEVRELAREADMIISKGGGNFDSLDEEKEELKGRITFLLLSKCEPYYRRFGVPPFQPVIANF